MTLSTLKQQIYSALVPGMRGRSQLTEAQLSVMQATFLALQTSTSLDKNTVLESQQIFQILLNRYFNEKLQVS